MRKFGGEDRARRLHGTISDLGQAEGLGFRFDLIRRVPHTLDAHRLVRWAGPRGGADGLVMALFAAHFCEGRDIANPDVLATLAGACGMDRIAARGFLASSQEVEAVHAENLRAHRLGINGVPLLRRRRRQRHRRRAGAGGAGKAARRRSHGLTKPAGGFRVLVVSTL